MMKKLFFLFFCVGFISCKNSGDSNSEKSLFEKEYSIFDQSFTDYKELAPLKDFQKISDTTFLDEREAEYRITQIKNDTSQIILFNKTSYDSTDQVIYSLLDTLSLKNLESNEFVSIGYCDYQKLAMPQIIAKFKMLENDSLSEIEQAWFANTQKMAIERIYELDSVGCEFAIIKEMYLDSK